MKALLRGIGRFMVATTILFVIGLLDPTGLILAGVIIVGTIRLVIRILKALFSGKE